MVEEANKVNVKHGKIKDWKLRYGFIESPDFESDVFFHSSEWKGQGDPQKGQEVVEKPELAAQRLIRHGIEQVGELPAGVESLKKGLGRAGPVIKMPMTRTAEAIETAKEVAKVVRKPSRIAEKIARPNQ